MTKRILLIGYYGKGNAGDEWLREKSSLLLQKIYPSSHISTSKTQFLNTDIVVYGGGGLFQNKTSNRSLFYYCFWILLAWLFQKPVFLLGQGIGPISGKFWNSLTRFSLKKATAISVRDLASVTYLQQAGYPKEKTIFATDLALYDSIFSLSYPHTPDSKKAILLNLRPWPHVSQNWPEIRDELRKKASLFISCSHEDTPLKGRLPHLDLFTLMTHTHTPPPLPEAPILVSMRFHACIWAAMNGIPFLALAYDDKVKQLAITLNQPFMSIPSATATTETIQTLINELSLNYTTYQSHLRLVMPSLLQKADLHEQLFTC